MPKTTHNHDPEFRGNAVNLPLSSGRPLKRVAEEPGSHRQLPPHLAGPGHRRERGRSGGRSGGAGRPRRGSRPRRRRGGDPPAAKGGGVSQAPARDPRKSHGHTDRRAAERYALIDAMRDKFAITELRGALDVSRSGYHASRIRGPGRRAAASRKLTGHMKDIHSHRHTRSCGSPRMTRELKGEGMACSEKRVAGLMRVSGPRGRPRRPFRPKTTCPDHAACPSPNLLKAAPPPERPGQQPVSDITYIPTRRGWLYLAVIIDLFSRAVAGWSLSDSPRTEAVTSALRRALRGGGVSAGAIFHSDRGCQHTAKTTRGILARHGMLQSMSAAGYCCDNAFAESFFASLKAETPGGDRPFEIKEAARLAVFDYIETFHNRRRRHSSLGYLSPVDFLSHHFQKQNQRLN